MSYDCHMTRTCGLTLIGKIRSHKKAWLSLPFFFVLPSQDAFWALVVLVGSPRYAMHGLLIPGLPKLLAYNDFHGNMRKRFLPKLHKHLVSINYCNAVAISSSRRSDVYLGRCGHAHILIRWSLPRNHMLNFRGWSQLQWNYFNSKIFTIYGMCLLMVVIKCMRHLNCSLVLSSGWVAIYSPPHSKLFEPIIISLYSVWWQRICVIGVLVMLLW